MVGHDQNVFVSSPRKHTPRVVGLEIRHRVDIQAETNFRRLAAFDCFSDGIAVVHAEAHSRDCRWCYRSNGLRITREAQDDKDERSPGIGGALNHTVGERGVIAPARRWKAVNDNSFPLDVAVFKIGGSSNSNPYCLGFNGTVRRAMSVLKRKRRCEWGVFAPGNQLDLPCSRKPLRTQAELLLTGLLQAEFLESGENIIRRHLVVRRAGDPAIVEVAVGAALFRDGDDIGRNLFQLRTLDGSVFLFTGRERETDVVGFGDKELVAPLRQSLGATSSAGPRRGLRRDLPD